MNVLDKILSTACDDEKRSAETLEPSQYESDKDAIISWLITELNAAKHDLKLSANCRTCGNESILSETLCAYCRTLDKKSNEIDYWVWRGICDENTEKESEEAQ